MQYSDNLFNYEDRIEDPVLGVIVHYSKICLCLSIHQIENCLYLKHVTMVTWASARKSNDYRKIQLHKNLHKRRYHFCCIHIFRLTICKWIIIFLAERERTKIQLNNLSIFMGFSTILHYKCLPSWYNYYSSVTQLIAFQSWMWDLDTSYIIH